MRAWRRWAAHNRVRVTIILGLVYVAFSAPTFRGLILGAGLVAIGQSIRFWAAGFLQKNVELAQGGPYHIVRHPLYLGSFLMGLGLALSVEQVVWWLLGYFVLFIAFFLPAVHVEELRLQSIFGAEYQDLMVAVPGLIPRISRLAGGNGSGEAGTFSWSRVVANRELRSAVAMGAILGLQGLKLWIG